jgi:hypothetical protein
MAVMPAAPAKARRREMPPLIDRAPKAGMIVKVEFSAWSWRFLPPAAM